MAVEVIRRSAGSLGKAARKRTARAEILGDMGFIMTRATVSRTNDSTLAEIWMRPFSASHASSQSVMVAMATPVLSRASRMASRARLDSRSEERRVGKEGRLRGVADE